MPIREVNVATWEEFAEQLKELREPENPNKTDSLPLLFRGQEDSDLPLQTTLDRIKQPGMLFTEYFRRISKIRPEIESFTDRKWKLPSYPAVYREAKEYDSFSLRLTSGRLPAYAYMAYLRHHGFPSPLLDWTRSSHIAAFFAFKKTFGGGPPQNRRASIFVLADEQFTVHGNHIASIFRMGPYVRTHRRHFLQQSEYTVCLIFDNEWRFARYGDAFDRPNAHQGILVKFNIPLLEGPKVLRLLDEYNLNSSSLFSNEEGLMETLAMREFDFG
jgi:hypothetical protein